MTIALDAAGKTSFPIDRLTGDARAGVIDRWIYVFTAASFIVFVLAGFVPDSFGKLAAIQAGQRPPFPFVLHIHAVLMGSFLLLLLAQASLVAAGNRSLHMRLGIAAAVLVPAIVITGIFLVPAIYHSVWMGAQTAPPPVRQNLQHALTSLEDIFLLQLRVGVVFSICMAIALWSRTSHPGTHKRLMFVAIACALPAAFDRMTWLPTTMPRSPLGPDIYTVLAFSPMLAWDLLRNHRLHRAYVIWAAVFLPASVAVYLAWDTPYWHATARHILAP